MHFVSLKTTGAFPPTCLYSHVQFVQKKNRSWLRLKILRLYFSLYLIQAQMMLKQT